MKSETKQRWDTQIHVKNAIHRKALLLVAIDIGFRSTDFENDENGFKTIEQLDKDIFTHIVFDIKNRKISANMAHYHDQQFGKLMSFEEFCVALMLDLAICTVYGDDWDRKLLAKPVKNKRKPSLSNPNNIRKGDWVTYKERNWSGHGSMINAFRVSRVDKVKAYVLYRGEEFAYDKKSLEKATGDFNKMA